MADTIGSAVIQIAADSSKLKAGVSDAKSSLQSLRDTAKEAGESLTSSSTNYLRALERQTAAVERQAATFGKSKAEIASYNAAQQGVTGTAAAMISRLNVAETSLKSQSAAAKLAALAAGSFGTASAAAGEGMSQLNFQSAGAMRGVIGVGRALADGNFARAGTGMLSLGTRVGATGAIFSVMGAAVAGTVGVIAAFAVAAIKGAAELGAYSKALILTGNYAGTTASQMSDMAKAISQAGGTQGKAAEVLTELAASGKIAAEQFQAITTAAIAMERAGGPAIASMIADVVKLGEEPVKTSAKLNETLHYLTTQTYLQIAALEEMGNKDAAAALAQGTYTAAMAKRAAELQTSLGYMQRAWNGVKDAAKAAWDAMLSIGRQTTDTEKIVNLTKQLNDAVKARPNAVAKGYGEENLFLIKQLYGEMQSLGVKEQALAVTVKTGKAESDGVVAAAALGVVIAGNASKTAKMNLELDKTRALYQKIRDAPLTPESKAMLATEPATLAAIRAKPEYQPTKAPAVTDDAGTRFLQTLREQQAVIVAQLESTDKLTAAEVAQSTFAKLIADLKEKKILTADQKSLLAVEGAAKAYLAQNVAGEQSLKLKEEQGKVDAKNAAAAEAETERQKKALVDMAAYVATLDRTIASAAEGRAQQYDAKLSVVGLGSQAAEQLASTKAIYAETLREQRALNDEAAKNKTLDSDAYKAGVEKIKAGLADALAANKAYYASLAVLQSDWKNGAKSAIADYLADAADVAKQSQDAFKHAFQGIEDALVTFVTTGKLSFSSLVDSIIADMARMAIKKMMAPAYDWLGSLLGLGMSAIGGGGGQVDYLNPPTGWGAIGGNFAANSLTTVNEHGPEMLRVGGKDMLMLGSQPGTVTPVGQFGQASGPSVTFNVASGVSRNELAAMFPAMKAQIKAELFSTMRRPGYQRA